ncbi:MAG: hypothetical protein ABI674_12015 [Spartobacteria bacterium]
MPVSVNIDPTRKLVVTTAFGFVSDAEFLQARSNLLADPLFDPSYDRLWDFSAVTEEKVSEQTLAYLVDTSPAAGLILRAVVVCMPPVPFQRVLDFICESRRFSRQIAAFPLRKMAEDWILSERAKAA